MMKAGRSRITTKPVCSVEAAVSLINGKWKCVILWHLLNDKTLRFNELRRRVEGASQRVLTTQLRELEDDGLVSREIFPQVPPKVEYSLTEVGISLAPILLSLRQWGDENLHIFADQTTASVSIL